VYVLLLPDLDPAQLFLDGKKKLPISAQDFISWMGNIPRIKTKNYEMDLFSKVSCDPDQWFSPQV
jgi:hypothetical protein